MVLRFVAISSPDPNELEDVDDDFDFAERFAKLQNELKAQMQEETVLNQRILENLVKVQVETIHEK